MVVIDNNVLSALAKIERLELLATLFDRPTTVPSVLDELHRDAVAGYDFVDRIDAVKSYNDGWLRIVSLRETELELAEQILDDTLSFTDSACIAVAECREQRFVTDDAHAGAVARQRDVTVWDLKLLLEAAIVTGTIGSEAELETVLTALRERDNYRFSPADRAELVNRVS